MFRQIHFPTALFALLIGMLSGNAVADDIDQLANGMIQLIKEIQNNRDPGGKVTRFNQGKSLGCLDAEFEVEDNLPPDLAIGLFRKPGRYESQVRFASASTFDDSEKDLRGMSIKIFGVGGESLTGINGEQHFLLNSYPALFVDTPETFYKFIQATYKDERWKFFVNPLDSHFKSLWIIYKARANHTSPFDIRYWSTTPFALGDGNTVKYSVKSCSSVTSELPDSLTENYLRDAMEQHLSRAVVCFDFMVQLQTNDKDMPIEDASVIWDEEDSAFRKVARIKIEPQDFRGSKALAACEKTDFSPWQSLPEHKPLGRMNQVRKKVYSVISRFRHGENRKREGY